MFIQATSDGLSLAARARHVVFTIQSMNLNENMRTTFERLFEIAA